MKNSILVFSLLFIVLWGCSTPVSKEDSFSVSGTKWTRSVSDEIEVLAFASETDCQLYTTKSDGTLSGSVMEGKYSISDEQIIFSQNEGEFVANVTGSLLVNPTRHQFKTATVSGDFITVIATSEETLIDWSHYSDDQKLDYTTTVKDDVKYTFKKTE